MADRRQSVALLYTNTCIWVHVSLKKTGRLVNSDGSRNFKTGGRGPGAVEFLGSGVCFDALSNIPYFI